MLDNNTVMVDKTLKILKELQLIEKENGKEALVNILKSICSFFELDSMPGFETDSDNSYLGLGDNRTTEVEKNMGNLADISIYSHDPLVLEKVNSDRNNSLEVHDSDTGVMEKDLQDNNPWESAGSAVAPGQIVF